MILSVSGYSDLGVSPPVAWASSCAPLTGDLALELGEFGISTSFL